MNLVWPYENPIFVCLFKWLPLVINYNLYDYITVIISCINMVYTNLQIFKHIFFFITIKI